MSLSGYSRRNRRGLTLRDLCVVLVILVLLLAVAPIIRSHAFEEQNKVNCRRNLTQIFAAMTTYANVNNGNYPRTYFDRDPNTYRPRGELNFYTGANSSNSFGADGPSPNDVTASIFLLLKVTQYPPEILVCPSGDAIVYDPVVCGSILERSNFPSRQYFDYSMENPFPTFNAVRTNWQWNSSALSTGSPLFSDMNPGTPELATLSHTASTAQMRAGNSMNHDGRGQNVLYGDKSVEWQSSPFCGPPRADQVIPQNDNIFTSQTNPPTVGGWPQNNLDAVMLPLATTGFQPPAKAKSWSQWVVIGGVGGFLFLVVIVVLIVLLTRKKPATARGYSAGGGYPPPPPPLPPQQY